MALVGVALAVLPFALEAGLSRTWVRMLDFALLYTMLALGLNIVVGFAGLLDLGYIAFYAVGAYTYALLASPHFGVHLPFWILLPLGALVAAVFGVLLGAPTLRLRGDYLAIVTLGLRRDHPHLPQQSERAHQHHQRAARRQSHRPAAGRRLRPRPKPADPRHHLSRHAPVLLRVPGADLADHVHLHTPGGFARRPRLDRDPRGRDRRAGHGINTRNIKLLAFAMGATFGGVAGGLFSSFQGFVSPESFQLMESIMVLCMVVLGGMGHVAGVVLGALLLATLPEVLRHTAAPVQQQLFGKVILDPESLRMLLFGLALILVMLLRPAGLWPSPIRRRELAQRRPARSSPERHAAARSAQARQVLRRTAGAGRRLAGDRAGRDLRADRPERRRQDHDVQRAHRPVQAQRRRRCCSTAPT